MIIEFNYDINKSEYASNDDHIDPTDEEHRLYLLEKSEVQFEELESDLEWWS